MGSSKRVTVGHKYAMGQHIVFCAGPIDHVSKLTFEEKTAWSGRNSGGAPMYVRAESLFGGDDGEGGVSGTVDVLMGSPTQTKNSYLQSLLGLNIPAFRGVFSLVFNQFYFGNSPYLKNLAIRATRILKRDNGEPQWYPDAATIYSGKLTQAQAIYIALDCSGSMDQIGTGGWVSGKTRLENAKTAINIMLDYIAGALTDFPLDVCVVGWSTSSSSITRRNATVSDINAIKAWVNSLTAVGGTSFATGVSSLSSFFSSTDALAVKRAFLITDGETSLSDANAAAAVVSSVGVPLHAVNIDTTDTTYTSIVDNTATDGVAIVEGGSPVQLINVFLRQYNFQLDMNPAHILRECATSKIFGMKLSDSDIDDAAFFAAADQLYAERMGISLLWDSDSMSLKDFVDEICRHIDASFYVNQEGLLTIKLIRDDHDVNSLIELDESNICDVFSAQSTPVTELINSVTGVFWDAKTGKDASITVSDPALVQMQGRIKSTTLQYPGFTNSEIVARRLQSDLQTLSNSMFSCEIVVNRLPENLNNGSAFLFTWPELNIHKMIMRVADIDWGDGRENQIKITATQDSFTLPEDAVVNESPGWIDPAVPAAPAETLAIELPYFELCQKQGQAAINQLLASNPEAGFIGASCARPSGSAINARIALDTGGGYQEAEIVEFASSAVLTSPVDYMDTVLECANVSELDNDDLEEVAQMGNELVAITHIDYETHRITVTRGILDTVPALHDSETRIFVIGGVLSGSSTEFIEGETIQVKAMPITSSGQLDISAAPAIPVNFNARAIRPYPPGQVRLNGHYFPLQLTGDLVITVADRNRLQQTGGSHIGFFDNAVTGEAGVTYTVNIYNAMTNILTYSAVGWIGSHSIASEQLGGALAIRIEVFSHRDGYDSYTKIVHECGYLPAVNILQFFDYTPPSAAAADMQFFEVE
ncbi:MAG: VWA domain-containing protein [Cellvibrio sp.]